MAEPQGSSKRKWDQSVALNAATPVAVQVVKSATTSTLFVKKIVLSITTHGAADVFIARDTGAPLNIAKHTDAAAAAGVLSVVTWDFAGDGVELTLGKNFEVLTGATMTGIVSAEGFEIYTP